MIVTRPPSFSASRLLLGAVCIAAVLLAVADRGQVDADVGDSDRLGFSLGKVEWITRNVVIGDPIPVCSTDYPVATQAAIARWNTALGITAFMWLQGVSDCDDLEIPDDGWDPMAGVVRVTVSQGTEPVWDEGKRYYRGSIVTPEPGRVIQCRFGEDENLRGIAEVCVGFDHMGFNPEDSDGNSKWQTYYGRAEIVMHTWTQDGNSAHLIRNIAHELGHILGLADYYCDVPGYKPNISDDHPDRIDPRDIARYPNPRTLMNSWSARNECNPVNGAPTARDLEDYRTVYTPAAVTGLKAQAVFNAVWLSWNQDAVFVESGFEIQRQVGSGWVEAGSVDAANATVAVVEGHAGRQQYRIVARTKALPAGPPARGVEHGHAHGAASSPVSVPVGSTLFSLLLVSVTSNAATVSWTPLDTAQQYVAKSTRGANCDAAGEEETITLSSSDAAEGASGAAGTTVTHSFSGLEPSTAYRLCVRAVRTIEGFVLYSKWTEKSATTEPLPKLTVTVRPASVSCQTGSTVSISWRISGGTAPYAVKVGGVASSGTSKTVTCRSSAGTQTVTVSATDSSSPQLSGSATVTLTVTNPPPPPPPPPDPITCLSGRKPGPATYSGGCNPVQASSLLSAVMRANSDICAIRRWRPGTDWVLYGVVDGRIVPGSVNYQIRIGDSLWLARCPSTSDGASGASSAEPPECSDALKPASGPTMIDADSTDCATVRGGGAVQISRGDYTLNLTLSAERDWWVFAPTSYHDNRSGAFIFLDLTSGAWLALNPADGTELARHTPAAAEGLPALLDAIAASPSTPAK